MQAVGTRCRNQKVLGKAVWRGKVGRGTGRYQRAKQRPAFRILEKQNRLQMSQVLFDYRRINYQWFCFSRILKAGPRGSLEVPDSQTT